MTILALLRDMILFLMLILFLFPCRVAMSLAVLVVATVRVISGACPLNCPFRAWKPGPMSIWIKVFVLVRDLSDLMPSLLVTRVCVGVLNLL